MNYSRARIAILLGFASSSLQAAPENAYEGFNFESSNLSGIYPWPAYASGRNTIEYANYNGGMFHYSYKKETYPGSLDGGISLYGNPVSIVLGTDENWNSVWDQGVFAVWKASRWGANNPAHKPIFEINSLAGTTIFDSTNITVTNGSLSVGGSPVLTEGGAPALVQGLGYLHTSNFSSALASSAPPTTGAWAAAYVTRGNVTPNSGWMAAGDAQATGLHSVARGASTAVAGGDYSTAIGAAALASGIGSLANGFNVEASGNYSVARGWNSKALGQFATAVGNSAKANVLLSTATGIGVEANSYAEAVFGSYNELDTAPSGTSWVYQDTLFRIGNGENSFIRSDALKVDKIGKTTLTNRAWQGYVDGNYGPLHVPTEPQWGGSEALVVEGHARLKGKVIIEQPQGDISMGIFE